jgi:hypothetical protein
MTTTTEITDIAVNNVVTATQIRNEIQALRKQMRLSKVKIQRMLNQIRCDDDVSAENPVYDSGYDLRNEVENLLAELHNASNISTFDVERSADRICSKYDFEIDAL